MILKLLQIAELLFNTVIMVILDEDSTKCLFNVWEAPLLEI